MSEICRFLGIIIYFHFNDHPPPHFHVKYGDFRGVFSIAELKLIEGHLPKRIVALVLEWAFEHRNELFENWSLKEACEPLRKIEPLV